MGIFNRGNNPGAYSGGLICPVCQSQAIRYIENLGPYRLRYRCRKCGLPFQYDISNRPPTEKGNHPYAPFKKNKFDRVIEASERAREEKQKEIKL
jgi:rubredoxin